MVMKSFTNLIAGIFKSKVKAHLLHQIYIRKLYFNCNLREQMPNVSINACGSSHIVLIAHSQFG